MKKAVKETFILTIILLVLTTGVNAHLGIRPALTELNYKPGQEITISYYVDTTPDVNVKIYSAGDMNKSVSFDKETLQGGGSFNAVIKMPDTTEKPGPNNLYIRAEQIQGEGGGLGTSLTVGALVKIHVPYPGKYAEITLNAENANKGEPVKTEIIITNKGIEEITVEPELIIYDREGTKIIQEYSYPQKTLKPTEQYTNKKEIDTKNYLPGIYKAVAKVKYEGNEKIAEREFRIGELKVEIINATKAVYENKINPYKIKISSEWKNPIEGVYAEVIVQNEKHEEITRFSTSPIRLEGFQEYELQGFLDAEKIKKGNYESNITVHYSGEETNAILPLTIIEEGMNKTLFIIVGVIIIGIIFLITVIMRKKKNEKKKKE